MYNQIFNVMYDPKKYEQLSDREIQQRILNRLQATAKSLESINTIMIVFLVASILAGIITAISLS